LEAFGEEGVVEVAGDFFDGEERRPSVEAAFELGPRRRDRRRETVSDRPRRRAVRELRLG
jgi:hypothetical protein